MSGWMLVVALACGVLRADDDSRPANAPEKNSLKENSLKENSPQRHGDTEVGGRDKEEGGKGGAGPLKLGDGKVAETNGSRPAGDFKTIKLLVGQLADADSRKRESSRIGLMGLRRSDLAMLRSAVKACVPLEPSQAAALREIVTQVYLCDDPYTATAGGFLGIRLPTEFRAEDQMLLAMGRGVPVISRIIGFCSYRMLQDGDVILGIVESPEVPLNSPRELIAAVSSLNPGQSFTLEVQRRGQIVRVSLTLDRKPDFDVLNINEFENARAVRAEKLWDSDFAPLLAESGMVG